MSPRINHWNWSKESSLHRHGPKFTCPWHHTGLCVQCHMWEVRDWPHVIASWTALAGDKLAWFLLIQTLSTYPSRNSITLSQCALLHPSRFPIHPVGAKLCTKHVLVGWPLVQVYISSTWPAYCRNLCLWVTRNTGFILLKGIRDDAQAMKMTLLVGNDALRTRFI